MDKTLTEKTLIENQWNLILVGNPNVGKSIFFHSLTGSYAEVSNFPGTTVELMEGLCQEEWCQKGWGQEGSCRVIDTPGVYGLSGLNDEELVTLQAVKQGDIFLNVVDGTRLERDLFLTAQLLEEKKPMVVAVNMMDEVRRQGIHINFDRLQEALALPVIPVCAADGQGFDDIKKALKKGGMVGQPLGPKEQSSARGDGGGNDKKSKEADREIHFQAMRSHIDNLVAGAVTCDPVQPTASRRLGAAMLHPLFAIPILAATLLLIFLFIGVFLSQFVVAYTEGLLMDVYYRRFITAAVTMIIPAESFAGSVLIGEYGVLTMVPIYLLGLILPLIIGFYFLMSLLEDSGILPRIAVLCDRLFSFFGLNGKAIIPVLLGFGCVTMSLISTRILGTKRERTIAAWLLCVAVPCSAQFSIILALAFQLPLTHLLLYLLMVIFVFTAVGTGMNAILPGSSSDLFLTLPPLRIPRLGNVVRKTALKGKHFLMDAGPMFLLGGLLLAILSYTGSLEVLHRALSPVTQGLLGLPEESASLFITSMIKRDLGAAQLFSMIDRGLFTPSQIVVALTVITLLVPCFASVSILFKEQGKLQAVSIWLGSMIISIAAGSFMAFLLR